MSGLPTIQPDWAFTLMMEILCQEQSFACRRLYHRALNPTNSPGYRNSRQIRVDSRRRDLSPVPIDMGSPTPGNPPTKPGEPGRSESAEVGSSWRQTSERRCKRERCRRSGGRKRDRTTNLNCGALGCIGFVVVADGGCREADDQALRR